MVTPDLKPCPFCGGTDVHLEDGEVCGAFIVCRACLGSGPEHAADAAAVEAWNRRAEPEPKSFEEAWERLGCLPPDLFG